MNVVYDVRFVQLTKFHLAYSCRIVGRVVKIYVLNSSRRQESWTIESSRFLIWIDGDGDVATTAESGVFRVSKLA